MCENCRQQGLEILPEFKEILHPEFETELNPEQEWSSFVNTAKKYASPFYNWISGSSKPSTPSARSKSVSEADIVKNAIAGGDRNENSLTDKVFFKRHPELGGKPLTTSMPGFSTLSKEWLTIRDTIVRPILQAPPSRGTPIKPAPGTQNPVPGRLRGNLAATALQEWNKWGQGSRKENDSSMQSTLRDYWITGTGSEYGYINKLAWSGAFISWVVKNAGGGSNFKYSGAHTTYTYYAKQNRLQNNSNPFKAYRITEKKPEAGDIVVRNQDGYSFTYDNLQPDKSGTHGDIVVKVNASTIEVIGGNLSDSVGKNNSYALNSAGFLSSSAHFAIIKIEEDSYNREFENGWEMGYETSFPEINYEYEATTGSLQTGTAAEYKMVQTAISNGERNENVLSDMVFFARHPELGRKPLYKGQTGFDKLSQEWLAIRDKIVRPLQALSSVELAGFQKLSIILQAQFLQLRNLISSYSGVALREADKGSRMLLRKGLFNVRTDLLPLLLELANLSKLPKGWNLTTARPLLVGNVLYNLAFPETINQGGTDRLGGKPDPTCFSASTQILLSIRFPSTYVRYVNQLADTSQCKFAGSDTIGPLSFVSTSLYKSLDSVLLQNAFDGYFKTKARSGGKYVPGDELKVHRQVFGLKYPPKIATYGSNKISAFRNAFVNGNARRPELINLCTGDPSVSCGNHSVALTRVLNKRVYFYNPWANEEERNRMFGKAVVTISGNGERPAESSMNQSDFEGQITTVFHN
jgi:hypothetical protein